MSPTTAQQSYPQVALLKQIQGVGTLIALTFLPTLEDPHRFRKIRDVGCYLRLQPGRRNSGQIDPQLHLSKEGDLLPANAAGARSAERRGRPKKPSGWTIPLTYCTVSIADPVTPPELASMVLVPAAMQFARPATLGALATVATGAEDELQWLFRVMSCVLASLNVPVATKDCVPPAVAVTVAGVTASETSVPVPTVKVVLPVTPEEEAEIVTVPPFFP
jgi:hypothetical protein